MVYLLAEVHIINRYLRFQYAHSYLLCIDLVFHELLFQGRLSCCIRTKIPKSLLFSLSSGTFSALFVVASPNHCHHTHEHTLDQDQCQDGYLLQFPRRNLGQMLVSTLPACRCSISWLQPWQDSAEFLFLVKMCLSNSKDFLSSLVAPKHCFPLAPPPATCVCLRDIMVQQSLESHILQKMNRFY